jgi:copper chaperone NosL
MEIQMKALRILGLLLAIGLAGCDKAEVAVAPEEIKAGTACSLDGMLLADFPGPKGQILYGDGTREFFCDTYELFSATLQPEQARRVVALYTQDMGKTAWDDPQGNWIDAKSAWYVHGSRKTGSMGPTMAAFARKADAEAFAKAEGGKVLAFADVTSDMVSLGSGPAEDLH